MAVAEKLSEAMDGQSAQKSGRCREVVASGGSIVLPFAKTRVTIFSRVN